MKQIVLFLIRLYQKTLSPDHGWLRFRFPYGYCRFYPTCSEYAYRSIAALGVLRGGYSAFKHLIHCHPWSRPEVILPPSSN